MRYNFRNEKGTEMSKKAKQYSAQEKAKVAMEAAPST